MKKIKLFLMSIIGLFLLPVMVSAASGTVKVTGTSTAVVGNKVTVTVTLSSGTGIGSWQMNLGYDKNYLQLTSSTAEAGGTAMVGYASTDAGIKKKTYTFTFKTLKTGNTKVSVNNYLAYASNFNEMSLTSSSKTIKIITQEELEASYSKDNNLKSLSVEGFEISPKFSKDVLEYSVVVPENVTEINIGATENDSKASVNGVGVQTVTSGTNTFQIVVRAENGAEKTYTLIVEVKDANPINVTVDGKNYTVVKIRENLPAASAYQEYDVKINGFDIPAYKNENTNLVLVGLKDDVGNITLFLYDETKNEYKSYNEIGVNKVTIYPLSTDKKINGYTKGKVVINDIEVDAFYYDESSRFIIIYGVNIETGEKDFYIYDKDNQNLMLYNNEYILILEEKVKLYSYIIIGFSCIFVLLLLIIVFRKPKKKKRKKLTEEDITKVEIKNEEQKINSIEEIKDEEEIVYDILENNKKKKNKKSKEK